MKLIELTKQEMLGRIPADITVPSGYVIAGGAIRRWFTGERQDSDFDYFIVGDSISAIIPDSVVDPDIEIPPLITPEHKLVYKNLVNETYRYKGHMVQLILKEYKDIEELLNSFDFHHCQFAWDGTTIYTTKLGIISSMRKHLSFNNAVEGFQLDTLRRAFKYQHQGYTPCIGTLQSLASMFTGMDKKKLDEMVEMSPSGGKRRVIRYD